MKILILCTVTVLAAGNPVDPSEILKSLSNRVIGGYDIAIENAPYQVLLLRSGRFHCGGSIISKNWVLSAAHCIMFMPNYLFSIYAGSNQRSINNGSLHNIAEIIMHKDFVVDNGIPYNDIALLRVKEPFNLDKTRQPISLYNQDEETKAGANALVTGWGRTEYGIPNILQAGNLTIISKIQCIIAYLKLVVLPDGQICSSANIKHDSCHGDSGSALVIEGRQAGIVSWGKSCASPIYPGVYTEVGFYRNWILRFTGI